MRDYGAHELRAVLIARLLRGEHLVLYGPRGAGKSTLLGEVHAGIAARGIPCAVAPTTAHLDDITRAFERAYPGVDTAEVSRRRARARLRAAADRQEGVLLLDHATAVGTAMVGFLRRLRGGIAGVALVVDVETERERQHLRHRQLGTSTLPMPPMEMYHLRRLFRARCAPLDIPPIVPHQEIQILRAARGRPGWIVQCTDLIGRRAYWNNAHLYATVLCSDTEIALRQGPLRLLPMVGAGATNIKPVEKKTP